MENSVLVCSVATDGIPDAVLIFSSEDAINCTVAAMGLLFVDLWLSTLICQDNRSIARRKKQQQKKQGEIIKGIA